VRIAFFGLPLAGVLLAQDGHELVLASLCRPRWPGERRLRRALGDRVEVRPDVESAEFLARLRAARPELLVSWFWTTRLPASVLAVAPAFGVHPSLLPRWRGPDPYFWAIDSGDEVTGVTAHRLAEEYDTGAVLARRELAIEPTWSAWTLARRLDRPSLALLREMAHAFANGAPPPDEAQDPSRVTEAPAPYDDELEIDWTWPAERIVRRVRAASPQPGAYTFLGETAVTVLRARAAARFPRALAAGEAAVLDGVAVVRAGDGAVELLAGLDDAEQPLDAAGIADLLGQG